MNKTNIYKLAQAAPLLNVLSKERSFSKAAEKLGISQSAVSHRINLLEETLGYPLFQRTTRKFEFTDYGHILIKACQEGMTRYEQAFQELESFSSQGVTRLSVSSSVAMKWLVPHMGNAKQYGVELVLDVNEGTANLENSTISATIRFGQGPYHGLHSIKLKKAQMIPVVSPLYRGEKLNSSSAIILTDSTAEQDELGFSWQNYGITPTESLAFERTDLVLQAAISGMGIGLGRTLLIERDIELGFLKPAGPAKNMDAAYWLVCSHGFAKTQRYVKLKSWLLNEMC
jgi:LysR family glycine cleavage system transcriptional activator